MICKVWESRGKDSVVGGRDEPSLWVVECGAVLVIKVSVPLLRWILGICEAALSSLTFGNQADLSVSNISLLVGKHEVPTGCAPELEPFIDLSGIFGAHDAKSGFKGGAFDVICAPPEQQLFAFGTFDWEDRAELCAFECFPEDGDVYRCFFEPDNRAKGGDVDLLFAQHKGLFRRGWELDEITDITITVGDAPRDMSVVSRGDDRDTWDIDSQDIEVG